MRYAVLIVLASASLADAQTISWINPSGGTFSTPSNWSPAGPPGPGQDALFNIINSYSVNFTANVTNTAFSVGGSQVTFSLGGFTYATTAAAGTNVLGPNGSLTAFGGTLNLGSFSIGTALGNNSTVHFGSGMTATVGGNFNIGGNGNGAFTLSNGSDVVANNVSLGSSFQSSTGTGTATVNGAGSTVAVNGTFRVGEYGVGQFSILNGASVNGASLDVGAFPGANGAITVSGNNAAFTISGNANLGGFLAANPGNSATLNVNTGGAANFNGALNMRSVATINLNGGTLNITTFAFLPGAAVNWNAGKVQFANGSAVTTDVLNLFVNNSGTIGPNRTLAAPAGTFTLATPLVVAGTLSINEAQLNASVVVQPLGKVTGTGILTLNAGQSLQVENLGTLHSDAVIINNGGTITLGGPAAAVTGFTANNFGIVQGTGRFLGGLNNGTGGFIRALAGHHIIIDQTGLTNPGNIELLGGTIEYRGVLSNLANGFISGRGEFRGGTSAPGGNGLSNQGVIALSAGFTDIRGDVINANSGKIVTAGGGVTTFYDDVTHNGAEIRTQAGGRSVFFGAQMGAGPFTGTGIVEYSGDLRPGNSPALVTHEGTVILNSSATFTVELAGPAAGSGYDQLRIAGGVLLGGTLEVDLLGGYIPPLGQSFRIIDFTGLPPIDGTFNNLPQGATFAADGVAFQIDYLGGSGNDVVLTVVPVPEPTWLAMLLLVAPVLARKNRQ